MSKSENQDQPKEKSLSLAKKIYHAVDESKGIDPVLLDVSDVFSLADYFLIVSGRSDRHTQGIANKIIASLEEEKIKPLATEGYDKAHWILLDYDDVIVHIFYEAIRKDYDLESLWSSAKQVNLANTQIKAA